MATFKDDQGRKWKIDIKISSIKQVNQELGYNLGMVVGDEVLFREVLGDPLKFVATLYVLVEDQVKEAGLTESGFADMLYGDCYQRALEAMIEALADFCPSQQGKVLMTLLATQKQKLEEVGENPQAYIDAAMKQLQLPE